MSNLASLQQEGVCGLPTFLTPSPQPPTAQPVLNLETSPHGPESVGPDHLSIQQWVMLRAEKKGEQSPLPGPQSPLAWAAGTQKCPGNKMGRKGAGHNRQKTYRAFEDTTKTGQNLPGPRWWKIQPPVDLSLI